MRGAESKFRRVQFHIKFFAACEESFAHLFEGWEIFRTTCYIIYDSDDLLVLVVLQVLVVQGFRKGCSKEILRNTAALWENGEKIFTPVCKEGGKIPSFWSFLQRMAKEGSCDIPHLGSIHCQVSPVG